MVQIIKINQKNITQHFNYVKTPNHKFRNYKKFKKGFEKEKSAKEMTEDECLLLPTVYEIFKKICEDNTNSDILCPKKDVKRKIS